MSFEPFNRLVKIAARAFYDDITTKGENQPKTGRSDNRGIAVVVLDALTRRQWVREEDLAKDLKLHMKQLRRTLRFFEEEKLVTRDHRRETFEWRNISSEGADTYFPLVARNAKTAKGAKVFSAAIAATGDGQTGKEGEDKIKMHTHSYCCLDYAQIYDVVRYRLHRMKKKLKDELENKNTVQEYICPNCNKRYTALDAMQLVSLDDEYFHCEKCNGELVAESDKIAPQEAGDGDDNARRRRREKLKEMLQKMEEQLKPLMEQLNRVKDLPVPEFGTLLAWEARAHAAGRAMDSGANDASKSSHGYSGTPMPFLGDTMVEVAFAGLDDKEDVKSDAANTSQKVLPPWMITQGMNLTKEQRGEVKDEKMDGISASSSLSDDKNSADDSDDKKSIQDEYVKAYYAALIKKQQELEEEAARNQQELSGADTSANGLETSSSRQVGIKFKREEDEGDEDVEWEETNASATGSANGVYKVHDLNMEAEASSEGDDDIDWEEG